MCPGSGLERVLVRQGKVAVTVCLNSGSVALPLEMLLIVLKLPGDGTSMITSLPLELIRLVAGD